MLPLLKRLPTSYSQKFGSLVLLISVFVVSASVKSSEMDSCQLHSSLIFMNIETRQGAHRCFNLSNDVTAIDFKVKAHNRTIITLLPSNYYDEYFVVVIGSDEDTISVIRRCTQSMDICSLLIITATNDFLDPQEFRRFWINFGNNTIEVGRDNKTTPFMRHELDSPVNFAYLGYPVDNDAEVQFCSFESSCDVSTTGISTTMVLEKSTSGPGTDNQVSGKIWPLVVVFVILLIVPAAVYVVIRRKRKRSRNGDDTISQYQLASVYSKRIFSTAENSRSENATGDIAHIYHEDHNYETASGPTYEQCTEKPCYIPTEYVNINHKV